MLPNMSNLKIDKEVLVGIGCNPQAYTKQNNVNAEVPTGTHLGGEAIYWNNV